MTTPLESVRIIECSMLGPGAITTTLADLGADVIKVEPPSGDYIRQMTWPIVEGTSLMHLHISRGKRSITLDLRTEDGRATFLELVAGADAVIEAMRPGGLEKRGVGYEACKAVNPRIVFCTISGYGMTGPYKDMPSHGIAYDAWAGLVGPETTASTPVRCSARSACWPASHGPGPRVSRAASRSRSPTRPRRWTGSGARRGRPTSVPNQR
jgi:crotonobetainyl-CoA:carnitine CoA-transferase CaiB-like acyl-CoA transferase